MLLMRHCFRELALILFCLNPIASAMENTVVETGDNPSVEQSAASAAATAVPGKASTEQSLEIFQKRILPIFQSAKPSSCTECHLSGVDLSDYIQPDQTQTFASLLAAGLINREQPAQSKILQFIERAPEKSTLISQQIRKQELEAFRAWIEAAVRDPQLKSVTAAGKTGPELAEEVIRHARKDRVLASFVENIWTEVGRCAACHSPDRNQEQVQKHGEQVSWITLRDPQATLDYMLAGGLINAEEPLESLLLTKPTMQVKHGGGQKMVVGDRTYKQFRRFIDDYANVVQGRYRAAEAIPQDAAEVSLVTDIWFKLSGVPAKYDKVLLQADLYRWTGDGWSAERVATSDRPIWGGGNLWQHSWSLTAQRGSEWERQMHTGKLPPGRYLVKLYLDQAGKLEQDFRAELGPAEYAGQVEVQSDWNAGYGRMTVAPYPAQ